MLRAFRTVAFSDWGSIFIGEEQAGQTKALSALILVGCSRKVFPHPKQVIESL
jgi:hypothetical protein